MMDHPVSLRLLELAYMLVIVNEPVPKLESLHIQSLSKELEVWIRESAPQLRRVRMDRT